jgi:hypothetical protein
MGSLFKSPCLSKDFSTSFKLANFLSGLNLVSSNNCLNSGVGEVGVVEISGVTTVGVSID